MTDYCTDQWCVVKYPCGAGGKFLANCLFLFDQVAHWDSITGKQETVDYFQKTILQNKPWLKKELNHKWGINFFSRSYERNNDASVETFNNEVVATSTDYFNECWNKGLTIVDHWGKPYNPSFWEKAKKINIIIDDYDRYKKLVMTKLFKVEGDQIISLLDIPQTCATSDNLAYTQKYNNQYQFPLMSTNEFFETHVEKLPWLDPWLYDSVNILTAKEITFKLSEILDYNKFIKKFKEIEDLFSETISKNYLKDLHTAWTTANENQ